MESTLTNVTATVTARNGVVVGQVVQLSTGRWGTVRWVRGNLCGVRNSGAVANTTCTVLS